MFSLPFCPPRLARSGAAFLCLLLAGSGPGRAAEVSREASAAYRQKLAPLLTPRSEAIQDSHKEVEKDAPGVTLLEETLHYVDAQGRRIIAEQLVYKPLTEAGAKAAAESIEGYRKGLQKFAVLTAETIQADGTIQAVRDDAILLQSPQRQASYALYDDQAEVRTIFPNVKAGSIVRMVFVTEDVEARMPNEYTSVFTWTSGWPKQRKRFVIDLPASLSERLKVVTTGETPEPTRETPVKGRVRLTWQLRNVPMGERDIDPAPAGQFGPCVHLSTVAQWADIGRWFNGMVAGRNRLAPALSTKVDEWTKGASSAAEVRRILFSKVADDVRYTGLELGAADYQPHDCNEVWTNQYGDCKDKANLLVAMLRQKGQDAYVTLLNTEHAGLVDRRVPDYRAFSHAIVAVRAPTGEYQFSDPTMARGMPGMLGGSDTDRDVLVIREREVEWVRTPAQSAGTMDIRFELSLKSTGDLGGWLTFASSGSFGAYYADIYQKLDAIEGKQAMQGLLREFYPGAELIDFVKPAAAAPGEPYALKAYFTIRNPSEKGAGTHTLVFPQCRPWLGNLGNTPDRHTPYHQYGGQVNIAVRVRLFPGLAPVELPASYSNSSAGAKADARWTYGDDACAAEFSLVRGNTLIAASDFPAFYRSMQSLSSWLEKPVLLGSASNPAAKPATSGLADDFPVMPSSEGQFALLEKLYPAGGNAANRRAALERILQYFPNDKTAVYQVGVVLALMDSDAGKAREALFRLHVLNTTYQSEVRVETLGWGQGIEAYVLGKTGDHAAALKLLVGLAGNAALPEEFRAQKFVQCADTVKSLPEAGTAELLRTAVLWHTTFRPHLYVLWAHVALQLKQADRWREALADLLKADPVAARDLFLQIARESRWNSVAGDAERQAVILEMLATAGVKLGAGYTADLARIQEQAGAARRLPGLRAKLAERLAGPPLAAYYVKPDPALQNSADFERELGLAETRQDYDRYVQLCLQQLVTLPADDSFGPRLWRAAYFADYNVRHLRTAAAEALLGVLLDVGRDLPSDLPAYHEINLLRGTALARENKRPEEQELYRKILADPELKAGYRARATVALGKNLEAGEDWKAALEVYQGLEQGAVASPEVVSGLIREIFLCLHYHRFDDAIRIIRRLGEVEVAVRSQAEGATELEELIALVRSDQAEDYWRQEYTWWGGWDKIANELEVASPEVPVPIILDKRNWVQALNDSLQRGNTADIYRRTAVLATAARWLPSQSLDFGDVIQSLQSADRRHAGSFAQIGTLLFSVPLNGPAKIVFTRKVALAACLLEVRQPAKAAGVMKELRKMDLPHESQLVQAYHRVRASCAYASGVDRAEAGEALAADLAKPEPYLFRAQGVGLLVDLYHALEKFDAEEALITREVEEPDIKANTALYNMLMARLAELYQKSDKPAATVNRTRSSLERLTAANLPAPAVKGAGDEPNLFVNWRPGQGGSSAPGSPEKAEEAKAKPAVPEAAVVDPLKPYRPDWYDYVAPKDLADPRLRRLPEVLRQPGNFLDQAEIPKLLYLLAADPKQPPGVRSYAVMNALRGMQRTFVLQKERVDFVAQVVADENLALEARQSVLGEELLHAARLGQKKYFDSLTRLPLAQSFDGDQNADLKVLTTWAGQYPAPTELLVDLAGQIVALGLNAARSQIYWAMLEEVELRGDTAALRKISQALSTAAPGAVDPQVVQLEIGRIVSEIEAHAPVLTALRETLLARRAPATLDSIPPGYEEYCPPSGLVVVTDQARTLAQCRYLLRSERYWRQDFSLWEHIFGSLPRGAATTLVTLDLAEQGLRTAPNDEVRAEWIRTLLASVDTDDPAIRQGLMERWSVYRRADAPMTMAQIRLFEITSDLRQGKPVDLDSAFAGIDLPALPAIRARIRLRQFLAGGDDVRLKRELANLDASRIAEPGLAPIVLGAYERLGMTAEAEQARAILRRILYRITCAAWVFRETNSAKALTYQARALGEPDALPRAWLQGLPGKMTDQLTRNQVLATDARLRKDWPALLEHSDAVLRVLPTYYFEYYLRGLALVKLGRPAEARAALQVYVEFSKDELDYPDAQALLAKLKEP